MWSSGQLFRACWPSSAEHTATSLSGFQNFKHFLGRLGLQALEKIGPIVLALGVSIMSRQCTFLYFARSEENFT